MEGEDQKRWKTETSEVIHKNPWFSYLHDQGLTNSGKPFHYYYFAYEHCPVNVVALTKDHKLILVRQYRYLVNAWSLEVPGGRSDSENVEQEAVREFFEETGYQPGTLAYVGRVQEPASNRFLQVYLALDCVKAGVQKLEETESGMTVQELAIPDVWKKIEAGEIFDSSSLASLFLAQSRLPKD